MAEPTITDVYERLGGLTSKVDGVREDLADAKHEREKMVSRVDDIAERTAKLEQTMTKLEPTVDSLTNLRARALGGLAVLFIIFSFVGWLAGLFLTELKQWFFRVSGWH